MSRTAPSLSPPAPRTRSERLIMDLGMNIGQDTRYYLEQGFRVVAVEAEPVLAAANRQRFAAEIAAGRLEIVNCAIAERDGVAPFWVFPDKDEWNTLDPRYAQRGIGRGLVHHIVEVPSRRFECILAQYGIPHYLKIDIEGADLLCARALQQFPIRPRHVSIEMVMASFESSFEILAQLYVLGYRRFKLVNQALIPSRPMRLSDGRRVRFAMGSAGPFGEQTVGRWQSAGAIVRRLRRIVKLEHRYGPEGRWARWAWVHNGVSRLGAQRRSIRSWRAALTTGSWYDLHATGPE